MIRCLEAILVERNVAMLEFIKLAKNYEEMAE
jgi:hypothetical protein